MASHLRTLLAAALLVSISGCVSGPPTAAKLEADAPLRSVTTTTTSTTTSEVDEAGLQQLCDDLASDAMAHAALGVDVWLSRLQGHAENPAGESLPQLATALQRLGERVEGVGPEVDSVAQGEEISRTALEAVGVCVDEGLVSFIPDVEPAPPTAATEEAMAVFEEIGQLLGEWNDALTPWVEALMDDEATYETVLQIQESVRPQLGRLADEASALIENIEDDEVRASLEPLAKFSEERHRRINAVFDSFLEADSAGFDVTLASYMDLVSAESMVEMLSEIVETPVFQEALEAEGVSTEEFLSFVTRLSSGS